MGVSANLGLTKASKAVVRRHRVIFPLVLTIAVLSPLIGFFVTGLVGVAIGLVISLASFLLGLRAVDRERHFHHYEA